MSRLLERGHTHWLSTFIYQNEQFGSRQYYHMAAPSPQAASPSRQTHVLNPLVSQPRLTRGGKLAVCCSLYLGGSLRGWPQYAPCGLTKLQAVLRSPGRPHRPAYQPFNAPRSLTRLHSDAHARGGGVAKNGLPMRGRRESTNMRNQTAVQRLFVSLRTFQGIAISS